VTELFLERVFAILTAMRTQIAAPLMFLGQMGAGGLKTNNAAQGQRSFSITGYCKHDLDINGGQWPPGRLFKKHTKHTFNI